MDASTSWGVGFWMEGKWIAWRSIPGWKSDGQDIGWLEMVTVELALHTVIGAGYKDVHLVFRSDNSASSALQKWLLMQHPTIFHSLSHYSPFP